MKRRFFILLCACMEIISLQAQTASDFRRQHLELWQEADSYVKTQRSGWQEIWRGFGVDSMLAEAVVFPEMVRFSKLQNQAETVALRLRYAAQGSGLCDYSIGRFQMKPSFVEKLEKRWMKSELASQYGQSFDLSDSRDARIARIDRMEDELWQCVYLSMFIRLLYLDYPGLAKLPSEKQVAFVAAAYNRGCPLPGVGQGKMDYLEKRVAVRSFHTLMIAGKNTVRYVYSEIATLRYKELQRMR